MQQDYRVYKDNAKFQEGEGRIKEQRDRNYVHIGLEPEGRLAHESVANGGELTTSTIVSRVRMTSSAYKISRGLQKDRLLSGVNF